MADRQIKVTISGNSDSAQRAFKELESAGSKASGKVSDDTEKMGGRVGGVFKSMLGSALGFAAAYVGISTVKTVVSDATSAFGDQQTATVLLNQALTDTGQKATPALNSALTSAEAAMLKYGDTTATTESALQTLILRGVPAKGAIGDLGEIADIAAAQHTTLAAATTEVAKAASGKMSPALKELGATTLPKGVTGVAALNLILGEVKGHVAGAADAVSKTMPGALATMGATITDKVMVPLGGFINKGLMALASWVSAHATQISAILSGAMNAIGYAFNWIGTNVMPIVMNAFKALGQWISQNQPLIKGIADVIGTVLTGAFKVLSVAVPIAIAIIGRVLGTLGTIIGAVVTALEAIVNWGGWKTITSIFGKVFSVVGAGIGVGIVVISSAVKAIASALSAVISWTGWGTIGGIFSKVFGGIATVVGAVVTVITDIVTGIQDVITWLGKLGGTSKGIVPSGGSSASGITNLPRRALGGMVSKGMSYLVGESGPEIYTMGASGYVTPNSVIGAPSSAVGGNTFYQTFNVVSNDGTAVVNALKRYAQANGTVPITVSKARVVGA